MRAGPHAAHRLSEAPGSPQAESAAATTTGESPPRWDEPLGFALLITGPPGAGKTSVLEALTDALTADDVPHATVEVEALTSAHPPLDDDQWTLPTAAICGLCRRFG